MAPRSFLETCLPPAANLATAEVGVDLEDWPPGIGVHLGIQDHQVHIPVLRHDVVDAAEADIIGPAVAADGPDGLLSQVFLVLQDVLDYPRSARWPPERRSGRQTRRGTSPVVPVGLVIVDDQQAMPASFSASMRISSSLRMASWAWKSRRRIRRYPRTGNAPSGAAALDVLAVGQDGSAAGDGGGAASGVAGIHPIAHQLAEQLDVGGLRAASAGGRELEVGLGELDVLTLLLLMTSFFR